MNNKKKWQVLDELKKSFIPCQRGFFSSDLRKPPFLCFQIITIDEAKRRQSFSSCDGDLPAEVLLQLLSDPSDLLQDAHVEKVFFFFFSLNDLFSS